LNVSHATGEERGRLILELDVGDEWRVDHFVDGLGFAPGLELELFLILELILKNGF
jgi:hypothetical protein